MERIEKFIDIDAPVQAVYDQWARFEEFPDFVGVVREVRRIDDTHLHWRAALAGEHIEWRSEIVEQTPFESIAWRSDAGMNTHGKVRFEPLDTERTRVIVVLELDPQEVPQDVRVAPGAVSQHFDNVLSDFKRRIEAQDEEIGVERG